VRDEEIMTILQEECAEVIQIICKIRRFGIDQVYLDQGSNRERLTSEVGDLQAMIDLLQIYNVVDRSDVDTAKLKKFDKLQKWSEVFK
jgi:NTP pyrophosphatase (non-canonical NTP hydrolase)